MSFLYEAVDKIVGDSIEKMNPVEIARKKSVDMINDEILKQAEKIPGIKQAVDFAGGVENEAQAKVIRVKDAISDKTGLTKLSDGVSNDIDGLSNDVKKQLRIIEDDGKGDFKRGEDGKIEHKKIHNALEKYLKDKGYDPSPNDRLQNEQLARRQYEMNYINKAIENVKKSLPDGELKTEKIRGLNGLADEVLSGKHDLEGHTKNMPYGKLSMKQEADYYDNILNLDKGRDDARVISWNTPGQAMTQSERAGMRGRIAKAVKNAEVDDLEKTRLLKLLRNKKSNTAGSFILKDDGELTFWKPSGKMTPNNKIDLKTFKTLIDSSSEFGDTMKNNFKLGSIDSEMKPDPGINIKSIGDLDENIKNDRKFSIGNISKDIRDGISPDNIENETARIEKETGYKRGQPLQFLEPDPTIQQPGQEPEDFELGEIKRPEEEEPEEEPEVRTGTRNDAIQKFGLERWIDRERGGELSIRVDTPSLINNKTNKPYSESEYNRLALGQKPARALSQINNLIKDGKTLTEGETQLKNDLETVINQKRILSNEKDEADLRDAGKIKQQQILEDEAFQKQQQQQQFTDADTKGLKEAIGGDEPKTISIRAQELEQVEKTIIELKNEVEVAIPSKIKGLDTEIKQLNELGDDVSIEKSERLSDEKTKVIEEQQIVKKKLSEARKEQIKLNKEIKKRTSSPLSKGKEKEGDLSKSRSPLALSQEAETLTETPETGSSADMAGSETEESDPIIFKKRKMPSKIETAPTETESAPTETETEPPTTPPTTAPPAEEDAPFLTGAQKTGAAVFGAVGALGGFLASKDAIEKEIEDLKKEFLGSAQTVDGSKKLFEDMGKLQEQLKEVNEKIAEHHRIHGAPKEGAGPGDFQTSNQRKQIINQVQDLRDDIRNLKNAQSNRGTSLNIVNNPSTQQSDNNKARDKLNRSNLDIKDLQGKIGPKTKRLIRNLSSLHQVRLNKLIQLRAEAQAKKEKDKQKEDRIRRGVLKAKKPVEVTVNIKNNNKPMNKIISKPVLTNTGGNIKLKNKPINQSKNINNINTG